MTGIIRRVFLGAAAAVLSLALVGQNASAALPPTDSQGSPLPTLAPMLERVTPAVVNIATRGRVRVRDNPLMMDPFFQRFFGIPDTPRYRETQSLGSGVIVDAKNGYIITNNHVVDKADEISVTLRDGRTLAAKLIGKDAEADIAVIQVPAEKLTAVPLFDSEKLRVGDFVVAIGNPFGLGQTVTSGIVSALGRSGLGIEGYEDFIQTDASINPGNSGGALVNLAGDLVGINTAILAPTGGNVGIGFAIPINMAHNIMQEIVQYGKVRRGQLGVMLQDLTPELARAFDLDTDRGAVVARVVAGSPAEKAGLVPGDIILAVNGRSISHSAELRNAIGLGKVGQNLDLLVRREGKEQRVSVLLTQATTASAPAAKLDPRLAGATLQDIDESSPLFGEVEGVVVVDVKQGSPAAASGLLPGDVIVAVNRRPIRGVADLGAGKFRGGRLLLQIRRGDGGLFLYLE